MSRPERSGMRDALRIAVYLLAGSGAGAAAAADPQPYRYAAPIEIVQPAPFVELALPVAAYAHAAQPDLRDLRVVDASGERVPFALRDPRPAAAPGERQREAMLFPLPPRPSGNATWPSPVEVTVDGDRIRVRRSAAGTLAAASRESPGWLIDLGELDKADPAPPRLLLRWSGPAEFSAAYRLETSADLRAWRGVPGGQVMSLQSAQGVLAQPVVGLPEAAGRFIRLTWLDPSSAPLLIGAASVADTPGRLAVAAADELVLAASPAPPGKDPEPRGSLHFDLGGRLPLIDVELRFASGTRVAPVRLQGRMRVEDPWRELGSGVFYRIERDGEAATAPAWLLPAEARFIRVVPDERAAALDAAQTRLVVHARLASLVLASSGQPPLRLLVGSADAPAGALPLATLVPQLDQERKRFGRARLGSFAEAPEVARAAERAVTEARLRLGLLWAVLLVGVAGLGLLVWRLAKSGSAATPPVA